MKRKISLEDMDKEVDLFHNMFNQDQDDDFAYYVCKMGIRDELIEHLMEKYGNQLVKRLGNEDKELMKKLSKVIKRYVEDFDKIIEECN